VFLSDHHGSDRHRPATPLSAHGAFLAGLVVATAAPLLAWTLGARTVEGGGLVLGALAAGAIGALSTTVGAVAAAAVSVRRGADLLAVGSVYAGVGRCDVSP
jgi:hypothetical protein